MTTSLFLGAWDDECFPTVYDIRSHITEQHFLYEDLPKSKRNQIDIRVLFVDTSLPFREIPQFESHWLTRQKGALSSFTSVYWDKWQRGYGQVLFGINVRSGSVISVTTSYLFKWDRKCRKDTRILQIIFDKKPDKTICQFGDSVEGGQRKKLIQNVLKTLTVGTGLVFHRYWIEIKDKFKSCLPYVSSIL